MTSTKSTHTKQQIITRGRKYLEVRFSPGKGRGVFTGKAIATGKLIEACPILMVEIESVNQFDGSKMACYIFGIENDPLKAAMLLGFGSLYTMPARLTPGHITMKKQ